MAAYQSVVRSHSFVSSSAATMRLSSVLCTLFTAELVVGHAFVYQVHINGKPQGRGVGVRSGHSNDPVKNVNSGDMTCNKSPRPASQTLSVKGGDRV